MTFIGRVSQDAQSRISNLISTPHPDNDEFNSNTLNSNWTFSTNSAPTLVTPLGTNITTSYASVSGNFYYSINEKRRSWLLLQNGLNMCMHKPITLATNTLILARVQCRTNVTSATNNENGIGIFLSDETGGLATPLTNSVTCYALDPGTNLRYARFEKYTSGSNSTIGTTYDTQQEVITSEYIAIHKLGTNYHGWVAASSGNWLWMGSTTHATTFSKIGVVMLNAINNKPGTMLCGIDFIRRFDTDQFLL